MLQQFLALAVAGMCAWAILSPRVHTGVSITLGLGMIFLGCLAVFDQHAGYRQTVTVFLAGMATTAGGMLWRGRKARSKGTAPGAPRRRSTDFGALDEGEHA